MKTFLALALIMGLSLSAFANPVCNGEGPCNKPHPGGMHRGMRPEQGMDHGFGLGGSMMAMEGEYLGPKFFKMLNLSKEQKEKIKELHKGKKETLVKMHVDMKALHEKMEEALASEVTVVDIKKIHEEAQKKSNELMTARLEQILAIREILTLEQRKKVVELRKERMEKMMKRGPRKDTK